MATMQDVARLANVSLSTVSYAINNTRPISEATRSRIEAAMVELGYRRNAAARSLASRRSRTIALVLPTTENTLGGTLSQIVTHASLAARERDYHLSVWPGHGPDQGQEAAEIRELALQGLADGVLFMEVALQDVRVAELESVQVPAVMIGRPERTEGRSCVDIDFESTIDSAVSRLADLGHERIAFINHSEASRDRGYGPTVRAETAYRQAMESRHLRSLHAWADENARAGSAAFGELLSEDDALTAVIIMNELASFGVVAEAGRRGLSVPGDLSVLSIVTSQGVGELLEPGLATMDVPAAQLARTAVAKLIAILEGAQPETSQDLFPCEFVPGASLAPSPRTSTKEIER